MRDSVQSKKIQPGVFIQSCLVALFMDINCINCILSSYGISETSGTMTLLYISTIGLIIISSLFSHVKWRILQNKSLMFIIAYIAILYVFTLTSGGIPYVSFSIFFVFTIVAMIIPSITSIDTKTTLKAIMAYPIFGITRLSKIFVFESYWNEWISMGLSYAFLVPIVATITYFFIYFKDESRRGRIITLILSSVNFIYFLMLLQFGSRGPILIILLQILFLLTFRPQKRQLGLKGNKFMYGVLLLVGMAVLFFSEAIFQLMDSLLKSLGISSRAISKIENLSAESDISNGRVLIAKIAIQAFLDRPILGHGFDCFFQNTGEVYPHNIILQVIYDGGLLFFAILIIPIVKGMKFFFKSMCFSEFGIFVVLFFLGVLGGWFSGDLWKLSTLWLFVGMMIKQRGFVFIQEE